MGSQVPFTSINFGLDISPEGRLVTKWCLEASIDGIGKHHETPIFPISCFVRTKGINDKPGTPNYDLLQLAIKSLSKNVYPNIVNNNWSQNEYNPEDPDTAMSTMGCVLGTETITCKYKDTVYTNITFVNVWNMLETEYKLKVKVNGIGKYIDVEDFYVYDSSIKDFTKVKRVIKNPDVGNWTNVNFDNGKFLTATEDHPLPVLGKGRTFVKDLQVGDKILKANTENEYVTVTSIIFVGVLHEPSYDVETASDRFDVSGINSHNCRTMLGFDRHGMGYKKVGRGNVSPMTLNLPKLGIKHGICLGTRKRPDVKGFFEDLNEKLKLMEIGLIDRFYHICSQSVKSAPFMYENGTINHSEESLINGIKESMKANTNGIGFIGLAECCQAMYGKDHSSDDKKVIEFSIKVVKTIHDFCIEAGDRNNLNFSCYASPR